MATPQAAWLLDRSDPSTLAQTLIRIFSKKKNAHPHIFKSYTAGCLRHCGHGDAKLATW
jgi:hypothetical protein